MFDWQDFHKVRLDQPHPASLRHEHVVRYLDELYALNPAGMRVETLGESYEGREIRSVTVGWGGVRILAWSQMHGNEPTHTAVLLDLLHFLQRYPDHDTAHAILKNCTLYCVPMLNPDGAERYIRRNAQDIDINRDALQLQTPEGRILHDLVDRLRPQFAFNLHNQNRLTSAGGRQPQPATISLLVPPLNPADTQTLETIRAKQVAACFLHAMPDEYRGMISRYDADFMPRCFGEWVQQQVTATVTVEAGGWPDGDPWPLVHAHFAGLVNALEAIATGRYREADPAEYERLRRSSEHNLFDLLLAGVRVVDVARSCGFVVDLGITQSIDVLDPDTVRSGMIEDLGDLSVTGGIRVIDGADRCCLPGRFAYRESITPLALPTDEQATDLLAAGITSIIGIVDLDDAKQLEWLAELAVEARFPLNVGLLVRGGGGQAPPAMLAAVREVLLGILAEDDPGDSPWAEYLDIPTIAVNDLQEASESPDDPTRLARLLGFTSHTQIALRCPADLVLRRRCNIGSNLAACTATEIEQVLVAGGVAFEQGQLQRRNLGRLLKRFSPS